jgi:hypothetical protein
MGFAERGPVQGDDGTLGVHTEWGMLPVRARLRVSFALSGDWRQCARICIGDGSIMRLRSSQKSKETKKSIKKTENSKIRKKRKKGQNEEKGEK